MHLRITKRKQTEGPDIRYLSLAESYRVPGVKSPRKHVIHNFGRDSEEVRNKLKGLIVSVQRYLFDDGRVPRVVSGLNVSVDAVYNYGIVYVVKKLWEELGVEYAVNSRLPKRKGAAPHGMALLAMLAQRLDDPGSKLKCHEKWLKHVWFPESGDISRDQLYRALDVLAEHGSEIEEEVFWNTANLFDLEINLVFYDGTSTWFELDYEDQCGEEWNGKIFEGIRKRGYSKEGRDNDPQVIIALAVTEEGIPVRSWIFPGNTPDVKTVAQVKEDLRGMKLNRAIFVGDSGMYSKLNLELLAKDAGKFIIAMPVGRVKEVREDVLSDPGPFTAISSDLEAKEVLIGEGKNKRRYFLCVNKREVERCRKHRELLLQDLEGELKSKRGGHTKATCKLLTSKRFGRFLSENENGKLFIDQKKVERIARMDGKYVLLTNDDALTLSEVVSGYKGMWIIESCFRKLKTTSLKVRPVFHWTPRRIEAHIRLCVLALMIQRTAELRTKLTWKRISDELEPIKAVKIQGDQNTIVLTSKLTTEATEIFQNLRIPKPSSVL